jgi:hypothetical protein
LIAFQLLHHIRTAMTTIYAGREVGEGILDQLCQNKYVFKDHWA